MNGKSRILSDDAPALIRKDFSGRNDELDAYSIEEFCRRHSICRSTYYNLRESGDGPRERRAMGRVLITRESAQEWRQLAA
jgi:hypothetical protein